MPNGRAPPDQARPHRVCNNCYRELLPFEELPVAVATNSVTPGLIGGGSVVGH